MVCTNALVLTLARSNNYDDDDWDRDTYRFPSRSSPPRSEMPWRDRSGSSRMEGFGNTPSTMPNRLGSFESWRGGRERTVADEVVDKLSTVLQAAKVVTDDFLGKPRVPPPSM